VLLWDLAQTLTRATTHCTTAACHRPREKKKTAKPLFGFGLDKCQAPTKTALSLPLLNRTGERKHDERLEARDKDRERSLTSYCLRQNRVNLGRKGSSYITNQIRVGQ